MTRVTRSGRACRAGPTTTSWLFFLQATTAGEIPMFFGVVILGTRYEIGARADLWLTKPRSKYLLAPALGERTGLPRDRFHALWSCATFSAQSDEGDATEKRRWERMDDFVVAINSHRAARVVPSEVNCVDESMCK